MDCLSGPLQTYSFESTRKVLDTLDAHLFEPVAQTYVLSPIIGLSQGALHLAVLIDALSCSILLSIASRAPLPRSWQTRVCQWRHDAWTLTQQVITGLVQDILFSIPVVGVWFVMRSRAHVDLLNRELAAVKEGYDELRRAQEEHKASINKIIERILFIETQRKQDREESLLKQVEYDQRRPLWSVSPPNNALLDDEERSGDSSPFSPHHSSSTAPSDCSPSSSMASCENLTENALRSENTALAQQLEEVQRMYQAAIEWNQAVTRCGMEYDMAARRRASTRSAAHAQPHRTQPTTI